MNSYRDGDFIIAVSFQINMTAAGNPTAKIDLYAGPARLDSDNRENNTVGDVGSHIEKQAPVACRSRDGEGHQLGFSGGDVDCGWGDGDLHGIDMEIVALNSGVGIIVYHFDFVTAIRVKRRYIETDGVGGNKFGARLSSIKCHNIVRSKSATEDIDFGTNITPVSIQ